MGLGVGAGAGAGFATGDGAVSGGGSVSCGEIGTGLAQPVSSNVKTNPNATSVLISCKLLILPSCEFPLLCNLVIGVLRFGIKTLLSLPFVDDVHMLNMSAQFVKFSRSVSERGQHFPPKLDKS